MIDVAYAMAPAGGQAQGGGFSFIFVMMLIFFVFYFLLIRPQQKQLKERQQLLDQLEKGDEVVTNGGIHGTITGITDKVVTLEIAKNVRVKVSRSHIAGLLKDQMQQAGTGDKDKKK